MNPHEYDNTHFVAPAPCVRPLIFGHFFPAMLLHGSFGAVSEAVNEMTTAVQLMGTLDNMAPEQTNSRDGGRWQPENDTVPATDRRYSV